ncbi:MAG: succinate dehydrogenase, cytochrome b556 subunit [Burkholderiaceae bacterium]|nr:succinate dehydrogenase, cytochrome b556 subunit [Burkholderiaceae bacterium]
MQRQTAAPGAARQLPKFLNLAQIRYPVGAIASILHRVSGVVLAVSLPLLASALAESLRSPQGFDSVVHGATRSWYAPLLFVGVWALVHHIFAGVRHLFMDVGVGHRLPQARTSAAISIGAGIVAAVLWLLAWGLR